MLGNINQFWRITRELNIGEIRDDLEHPVSVRVLGSDSGTADRIARLIDPDPLAGEISIGTLADPGRERADLYVAAVAGSLDQEARRTLNGLSVGEAPLMLVQVESDGTTDLVLLGVPDERTVRLPADMPDPEARERFFAALVRTAPEVALPLGRRHPLVREAVADHLIRDTSRVNAEFAALASLPANIPLFGGIVGGMADIIVLTKNQVLLILKLAGLYGHDLELSRELILEIMPVVGSAFVWRTTARTLVGFVPPMLGLVPKAIIAYGGTFVIGETARYFYRFGRSPHPDLVKDLRAEGQRLALEALNKLRR